jgi:UrcA family protein
MMSANTSPTLLRGSLVAAMAALGLACAGPLHAQPVDDYGYDNDASTVGGVVVTAPHHERYGHNGAPIETVSTSRVVDVSDLDLTSRWGWREMRQRITTVARQECDQLDTMYPIAADDNPPCVRTAVRHALMSLDFPEQ